MSKKLTGEGGGGKRGVLRGLGVHRTCPLPNVINSYLLKCVRRFFNGCLPVANRPQKTTTRRD